MVVLLGFQCSICNQQPFGKELATVTRVSHQLMISDVGLTHRFPSYQSLSSLPLASIYFGVAYKRTYGVPHHFWSDIHCGPLCFCIFV
jgi:hypothetical protein